MRTLIFSVLVLGSLHLAGVVNAEDNVEDLIGDCQLINAFSDEINAGGIRIYGADFSSLPPGRTVQMGSILYFDKDNFKLYPEVELEFGNNLGLTLNFAINGQSIGLMIDRYRSTGSGIMLFSVNEESGSLLVECDFHY